MNRRSFLLGLGSAALAAPAIVRADSLMRCSGVIIPRDPLQEIGWYFVGSYGLVAPTLDTGQGPRMVTWGADGKMLEAGELVEGKRYAFEGAFGRSNVTLSEVAAAA